jgi:hypothetical protein
LAPRSRAAPALCCAHSSTPDRSCAASTARSSRHIASHDSERLQAAIDLLTDALLSHLSYEQYELVEPLARLGFYTDLV